MNRAIRRNTESSKKMFYLVIIMLIGTHFLGLEPFAHYVNSAAKPVILVKCIIFAIFAIKIYSQNITNEYTKWLLYLWIVFLINKLSSSYYRNQPLSESLFHGEFIYEFGYFYIITFLNPSIKQIEKTILYLGLGGLMIYIIQYYLLPTPIVESLTSGWRTSDKITEFDIQRFTVTGECIIYLCGLFALNKYFQTKNIYYLSISLIVIAIAILHGYRSIMFALLIAYIHLYSRINGLKLNGRTLGVIGLFIVLIIIISQTTLFENVISTIDEKNKYQTSNSISDIDRIIELRYFYENINKPWEWIFGAGFIGINFKRTIVPHNWVDLGFIGMSFMGGILFTLCWIKLLLLNIRKLPMKYTYISSFSIFVILSTLSLNVAFANQAIIIQTLTFYLFLKIKYYNKQYKNRTNESRILPK